MMVARHRTLLGRRQLPAVTCSTEAAGTTTQQPTTRTNQRMVAITAAVRSGAKAIKEITAHHHGRVDSAGTLSKSVYG